MASRRCGGDRRGNSKARRARKNYLLRAYGDYKTCPCTFCGTELTFETVTADRIIPGGSYRQDNIQPACSPCNREKSDNPNW